MALADSPPDVPFTEPEEPVLQREASRFWSGFALGADEAGAMLCDPDARLFTVFGGENRGKTCLLTAMFIQIANGFVDDFPYRFGGSRSLQGLTRLAEKAFEWKDPSARILPRTAQGSFRQPSFLHMAFKSRKLVASPPIHTLLTDMPGEWFEGYISSPNTMTRDKLEFLPRTDGFLVVVDAPLCRHDAVYRHQARSTLRRIVALRGQYPGGPSRPIAVVLTKYDEVLQECPHEIPSDRRQPEGWGPMKSAVRALLKAMEDLPEPVRWDLFPTAAFSRPGAQPLGVLAPLAFLLEQTVTAPQTRTAPSLAPPQFRGRIFDTFREHGGAR